MFTSPRQCAHCQTYIMDITTEVVHGDKAYCCNNCAATRESLHCAHCRVMIVDRSSLQTSEGQMYCCPNCLYAVRHAALAR